MKHTLHQPAAEGWMHDPRPALPASPTRGTRHDGLESCEVKTGGVVCCPERLCGESGTYAVYQPPAAEGLRSASGCASPRWATAHPHAGGQPGKRSSHHGHISRWRRARVAGHDVWLYEWVRRTVACLCGSIPEPLRPLHPCAMAPLDGGARKPEADEQFRRGRLRPDGSGCAGEQSSWARFQRPCIELIDSTAAPIASAGTEGQHSVWASVGVHVM